MRIINTASGMTTLLLGRLGENERTQFVFDVADWLEEYPAATIAMYNQLPHSEESYPVVISQPENGKVTWTVADSELQTEGYGRCELVAVEGETVVKGHIWKTRILESLDGAGEVPDPWESWMTEFTQLKGAAEDAAEAAEDAKESIEGMSVEATTLPAGSDATVTKTVDQVTGAVTMSFGLPQGRPGTPGYEAIDDAAGLGDTDKAWSADKLSKEFAKDRNNANISGSLKVGTYNTTVQDANTVAFGRYSTAVGTNSLASGNDTNARGSASQAFGAGSKTEDDASASAVFGAGNIAKGAYQLVFGRYNAVDNGTPDSVGRRNYIEIVGNGNGTSSRLNARTLDWQGNERLRGNLYVEANVDGSGGTQVAKITDIPDLAIDDTAGTGDTDVTWSADKITGELADKYEKPASGIPATDLASGVIPTVHNVPAGGTTGQVLTKTSGTDYATEWTTPQVATDAQVAQAVDDWLDENVAQETGYVLDRTLLLSNAAAPADLVGDLKNALMKTSENGLALIDKDVSWIDGYVNSSGVIVNSTVSITGLVTMYPGEIVKIGTKNSNITIIGFTSASSIAVGDTISTLDKTTTNTFEVHEFAVYAQTNIVLCVAKANYTLSFYKKNADIIELDKEIEGLREDVFVNTDSFVLSENIKVTSGIGIKTSRTKADVNFVSGEKIKVKLEGTGSIVSKYFLYFNGTLNSTERLQNQEYTIVLTSNTTSISVYCENSQAVGTGDLVFTIKKLIVNNDALEKKVNDTADIVDYYIPNSIIDGSCAELVVANGSFSGNGPSTGATNRIRTALIPFKANEKIRIENGTFQHGCGMWNGTPSQSTNTRNDNSFLTGGETILTDYDGYIVIVFRKSDNSNISPSDFDGSITIYNTLAYRNGNSKNVALPSYYHTDAYIKNKAARINTLGKLGDDVFVFITDIHWEMNAKNSPDLIAYLNQFCSIHKIFDGGDVINGSAVEVYKRYRGAIDGKTYHVVGNHDVMPPATGKDLYYGMDSGNNDQIGNPFEHYWYIDNVQLKIRYIVLNTFHREEGSTSITNNYDLVQRTWFEEEALDLPGTDWDVIVFTHILKTTTLAVTNAGYIESAIDNFNADTSHTGKVLAVFQGHTHWDGIYHTTGGVPIITTTCDKWDLSNESSTIPSEGIAFRAIGTITEQAFDVVILNREAKKFTCVRIGAPAQDNVDKYRTDTGFTWIGTLQEREISYGE